MKFHDLPANSPVVAALPGTAGKGCKMDRFVVQSSVLLDRAAADAEIAHREEQASQPLTSLTADDIRDVTNMVLNNKTYIDIVEAYRLQGKSTSVGAISKYIAHYRKFKRHFVPKKRGPQFMLSQDEELACIAVVQFANNLGRSIDAGYFAAAAKGIMRRRRPEMFTTIAKGVNCFSITWATNLLKRHNFKVRKVTTDRMSTPDQIAKAGADFYRELAALPAKPHPSLTFNADEWPQVLHGDHKNWTWAAADAPDVKGKHVVEKTSACVVSSATGEIVFVQLIWKGKTGRSTARPKSGDDPRIIQSLNSSEKNTHFQNSATWQDVVRALKVAVRRIRREQNIPDTTRGLFVYDQAPQHGELEKMRESFDEVAVDVILVPPKMTHVFQPADMYIIANLKQAQVEAAAAAPPRPAVAQEAPVPAKRPVGRPKKSSLPVNMEGQMRIDRWTKAPARREREVEVDVNETGANDEVEMFPDE
jgi:hypothetical protein